MYRTNAEIILYSKPRNYCEFYTMPTIFNELILDFTCAAVITPESFIYSLSNNDIIRIINSYPCFCFTLGFTATIWLTISPFRSSILRLRATPSPMASSTSLPDFSVFFFPGLVLKQSSFCASMEEYPNSRYDSSAVSGTFQMGSSFVHLVHFPYAI